MADTPSRKLAVILHADVVGSTSLVQKNESLAHQRFQEVFELFSKTIEAYGGVTHEIRGDALVAEFSRASDAVCASLSFQVKNTRRNFELGGAICPQLRIGISLGEVIVADGTVTGTGVVLAQRLEQIANPEKVVVQNSIAETVPTRMPFEYHELGAREVKGFERPVRAFEVRLRSGEKIPEPEMRVELAESVGASEIDPPQSVSSPKPSIAVLPFTNMSGDSDQEYFSDGITEDIITALSHISGLIVIARNSIMVYKGKSVDVKQVGREQEVSYVLEGSVRKGGDRIRVTAQLIDALTGHHLWADRYDRNLDDIFAVQDDITHKIMVEMRVQLSLGEKARMLERRTKSAEAWQLQLRADDLNNRFVREANWEARNLVEQALTIDPAYVSAWTELGWTHCLDAFCGWTDSTDQSVEQVLQATQKALELEPDYPFALSLLGYVYLFKADYQRAVELAERAVTLAPSNAEGIAELAHLVLFSGNAERAIDLARKAIQLTPMGAMWHVVVLGLCQYSLGQLNSAITTFNDAIALEPGSSFPRLYLVSALMESGQRDAAERVAREVMSIELGFSLKRWRGAPFKDLAVKNRIISSLAQAGLPE